MPNDINVNMTPNPLDLQTLHCSQGDTGARKFKIKLHNNGEAIDTSNVKEQVEFPVYKGGTEELLPTNTSTPTTSPIDADIQYPQGLLTDQVFTYRESPTEEDGKAKVKCIRGNTLKWNQLAENGNFGGLTKWTKLQNVTCVAENNVLKMTVTAVDNSTSVGVYQSGNSELLNPTAGHQLLVKLKVKSPRSCVFRFGMYVVGSSANAYREFPQVSANVETELSQIVSFNANYTFNNFSIRVYQPENAGFQVGDVIEISNVQIFDLTAMGLDITDPSEFTSLFPLPYYQYDTGSLLSFKGEGIKTVGKNFVTGFLADSTTANISWTQENGVVHSFGLSNGTTRTPTYTYAIPLKKGSYILSGCNGGSVSTYGLRLQINRNGSWGALADVYSEEQEFTLTEDSEVRVTGRFSNIQTTNYDVTFYPMIRYADAPSGFEPYTSSTLSLPISTYFQQGMNRVNDVYDELTPSKAITRIGAVDLGTLNWYYSSGANPYFTVDFTTKTNSDGICVPYEVIPNTAVASSPNKTIQLRGSTLIVVDNSYTNAQTFKTAMSGVYLVYELNEYEETPITTASLVTENGEIALKSEGDYLVGECNSDISENAGFIDAKVKLSDADGEIYSNKIQIHVERSPQ